MSVESKKYHVFPHITVSLILHTTVLMFLIAAIILSAEYRPDITLIIAIPISVLFAIMFLLLNVFFIFDVPGRRSEERVPAVVGSM